MLNSELDKMVDSDKRAIHLKRYKIAGIYLPFNELVMSNKAYGFINSRNEDLVPQIVSLNETLRKFRNIHSDTARHDGVDKVLMLWNSSMNDDDYEVQIPYYDDPSRRGSIDHSDHSNFWEFEEVKEYWTRHLKHMIPSIECYFSSLREYFADDVDLIGIDELDSVFGLEVQSSTRKEGTGELRINLKVYFDNTLNDEVHWQDMVFDKTDMRLKDRADLNETDNSDLRRRNNFYESSILTHSGRDRTFQGYYA